MKILTLKYTNFKGLRSFKLDTNGGDVQVYGANATGKTTLFDGFNWLLFDKDSLNRSDFDIKPLDKKGEAAHGLDHEVEGTFDIGDRQITLRKVLKEKWVKKRGSATSEFTGHSVDYYIDGVPVKKGEYDTEVAKMAADEKTFKVLTSPMYFNTQMNWQERRKVLLACCGDLTDAEVIASDKTLAKLPEILGNRKLEDHRKVIAARRTEINKQLNDLPIRIDEATRALPDVSGIDAEALQTEIGQNRAYVGELQQQVVRIQAGGEVAEKTKAVREIEAQQLERRNELAGQYQNQIREVEKGLDRTHLLDITFAITSSKRAVQDNTREITVLEEQMQWLRQQWVQADTEKFVHEETCTCPTCGQDIPEDQLTEAKEKALAQFNQRKAERLEKISADGKALKARVDQITADSIKHEADIAKATIEQEALQARADELTAEIAKLRDASTMAYANDPAYIQLECQKQELQKAVKGLSVSGADEVAKIKTKIGTLQATVQNAEAILADIGRRKVGEKRIDELKAQERTLAAEFEKLEGELYLTEQFIRAKVAALESKINSRFAVTKWKLFDTQINGGLSECCIATHNGVPFDSGLNNAARINCGIDIINTLSDHYRFAPCVFIDNAEAVCELLPTRGQSISLVVSKPDKELRVVCDCDYANANQGRLL